MTFWVLHWIAVVLIAIATGHLVLLGQILLVSAAVWLWIQIADRMGGW